MWLMLVRGNCSQSKPVYLRLDEMSKNLVRLSTRLSTVMVTLISIWNAEMFVEPPVMREDKGGV